MLTNLNKGATTEGGRTFVVIAVVARTVFHSRSMGVEFTADKLSRKEAVTSNG